MKIRKLKETVQEYNLRDRKLILKAKCQSPSLAELLTRKKTTKDLSEITSITKVELTPLIPRKMLLHPSTLTPKFLMRVKSSKL